MTILERVLCSFLDSSCIWTGQFMGECTFKLLILRSTLLVGSRLFYTFWYAQTEDVISALQHVGDWHKLYLYSCMTPGFMNARQAVPGKGWQAAMR